jgi:Na+-translocating ferredoxin:NAD+ oxidoreductase RnfE subunit
VPSTDSCVHQTELGFVVEGVVEKDSATVIVPLTVCPLTGDRNLTTEPLGVGVGLGLRLFETLTFSETVCSSWFDEE